ncbi:hypothetical protein ACIPPJ_19855 [Streptomyces sp. NPDC086091]|uniref:hypothetical protein n=1 Tax=Streptomyces sp. NPDC086091 TaxID=3365751 RepID=UPI003827BBBC
MVRLRHAPLLGRGSQIDGQAEAAQQLARPLRLVFRDDHTDSRRAQCGERQADIGVEVGLVEVLAATDGFPGTVFDRNIDAWVYEKQGFHGVEGYGTNDGAG